MRVVKPPVELSQWDNLLSSVARDVPKGFQNCQEIASERGLSKVRVSEEIRVLESRGLVETIFAKPPGKRNPMKYYRAVNYGKTQVGKKHRRNR
jgi:predicted ArsR family transcriptional regulator